MTQYEYTRWRRNAKPVRVVELDIAARTLNCTEQQIRNLVYAGKLTGYLDHDDELAFVSWREVVAYRRRTLSRR
jgi:hypothetical protein